MEKQAVVREGVTPSVESGKKSDFIKNGEAYSNSDKATLAKSAAKLEKAISTMYTGDK